MGYTNTRKEQRLSEFTKQIMLETLTDKLTARCKFNFHYFTKDKNAGQEFNEWTHKQLLKLIDKLKAYSENSLGYWQTQLLEKQSVLEIYGAFPKSKSKFTEPTRIPSDIQWGRFRLEGDMRLIGFIIPTDKHNDIHKGTREIYDSNTFYIVFLDSKHEFYKTKKR